MALIAQALTTLKAMRLYFGLYAYTDVTYEILSANATSTVFNFDAKDIAPNTVGVIREVSGSASDTVDTASVTIDYDAGTMTFTAAITGDITVGAYSYFAWDYTKDQFLERNINAASSLVMKYCNRKFIADTYTEYYKGSGRQKLVLNQHPINKITSVKVDSASMTAGIDYVTADQTYLDQGIIFKNNGWTWYGYLTGLVGEPTAPVDNIEVVYSAGYTLEPEATRTLPFDLENVCISMAANMYSERQGETVGISRITEGKLTYVYNTDSLVGQHASVLDAYKKRLF